MNQQDDVITILRANEGALRQRGILHAALFGSLARGDHRPDSDVDIEIIADWKHIPGAGHLYRHDQGDAAARRIWSAIKPSLRA